MKILVLGCKGQLGRCLKDQLKNTDHNVFFTSRENIDIADFKETKRKIFEIAPDVVINATAYTAVDKAEEDQEMADLINHFAVGNIANICKQLGCWLVHISTDYVFDGNSNVPYKEDDITNPQGIYGKTKLNGELAILSSDCEYLIIRTAWVFSEYGNNFLTNMLRLGLERDELSIVSDQVGCPTYAQDIASFIVGMLPRLKMEKVIGIYNFCGDTPCSWFDFAQEIFNEGKKQNFNSPSSLYSVSTSEFPTKAVRPAYSVLNCQKIKNELGINPSDWRLGIKKVLHQLR